MLNRLRNRVEGSINTVALYASKLGFSPDELTVISLIVALLGFFTVLVYGSGLALSLVVLLSGFIDSLDGALARLKGTASRRGAFLDSFIDRICEALFALSFIELGINVYVVVLFLVFSYLISYARARGESLGMQLAGVGLMERAERVLALAVSALLIDFYRDVAYYSYVAFTILTGITVLQRFLYTWKALKVHVSADKS
ncbi:MAG: CDP-alcohol phosphatidyltransferase family protein [Desulfurococcaceae archaeon]